MVKNGREAGCLDGIGEVSWMDEWLIGPGFDQSVMVGLI